MDNVHGPQSLDEGARWMWIPEHTALSPDHCSIRETLDEGARWMWIPEHTALPDPATVLTTIKPAMMARSSANV